MDGIQIISEEKTCASCKGLFEKGKMMWFIRTPTGIDYYCTKCAEKPSWYVYDKNGIIEASGLTNAEAEEMVVELNICEGDGEWKCAEDDIDGL